ncbi:hypothetical protein BKA63DRAFT_73044 [Paraphoma chrysanthemicola]|nr:hypothetical protein BKA63DRAFT_73044 [Paraphoma chrysanthemicola]
MRRFLCGTPQRRRWRPSPWDDFLNATLPLLIQSRQPISIELSNIADRAHQQPQSRLFELLPTELRLLIYEAALTEPGLVSHMLAHRDKRWNTENLNWGHWHCDRSGSSLLRWQQPCFGTGDSETNLCARLRPRLNTDPTSLLLTCRLIYSEAIHILYGYNTFGFMSTSSLLSFYCLYKSNWHMIRRIDLATLLHVPVETMAVSSHPRLEYDDWNKACTVISTLPALAIFSVNLTVWSSKTRRPVMSVSKEDLLAIFGPLQQLDVREFKVESNLHVEDSLADLLGPLSFRMVQRDRSYVL